MANYKKYPIKMNPVGMSLAYPSDFMPEGVFPALINTRFDNIGTLTQRNKLKVVKDLSAAATGDIYLIKRLTYGSNDYRLIHIASKLVLHNLVTDALTVLDSSFANAKNSTSVVSVRPEEAIIPYIYISNNNAFKKFSSDADYVDVGITAPNSPPVVKVATPVDKVIDELDGTGYTNSGGAGAPVASTRVPNTTSASTILFDVGSSGWVSIVPNTFPSALQPETIVLVSDATIPVSETAIVKEVIPAFLATGVATISSIQYDSGVSGDCTIQLSITPENIKENAILVLGGSERVRVKAVIDSVSQGKIAIRTKTVGTFTAGATVSGEASFRIYLQNTGYTTTNTKISTDAMKVPFAASGTGYVQKVVAIDLSRVSNRAISDNDIVRFAVLISDTAKLEEGQIQLDLSQTGGDFNNYIFYSFSPSSLTQSYKQLEASTLGQQKLLQRVRLRQEYIDELRQNRINNRDIALGVDVGFEDDSIYNFDLDPISVPNELNLGDFQWTVFEIPLSLFLQNRVGSDASRSLKDITAIRFSFKVNAAVDIYVDSLSIGGTYELDSTLNSEGTLNGYYWVYRYRSSKTRTVSAWSPPNRDGKFINRGRAELTFAVSPDAQADKIDIARFGGRLTQFYYIGTTANSSAVFYDELPDATAVGNPIADFTIYKPFAILDKSKKGICNVIGTEVSFVSGDNFNVAWARGSQIIIDGVPNSLYNSPSSATKLTLQKSVGSLSNVSFYLPEPLLTGQTLPIIFGPFGEGNFGLVVFGLGNVNAKGTIYWLNGNSPDTMHDTNYLEITDPSEPLIDGCIFRNIPYVFTNKRGFALRPTIVDGKLSFVAEEVEGVRGVRNRGCIAVSDAVYITSNDGVYRFDGGSISSISDDIYPLFPKDSIDGSGYTLGKSWLNGLDWKVNPITQNTIVSLAVYRDFLYLLCSDLIFIGGDTRPGIIVYSLSRRKIISIDVAFSDIRLKSINGDESQYSNELMIGGINEYYNFTALDSGAGVETAFLATAYAPSLDFGDSRILKEFYEIVADVSSNYDGDASKGVYIEPYLDNYKTRIAGVSHIIAADASDISRKKVLLEMSSVFRGYNIGFAINLLSTNAKVFEVQPSFIPKTEKIQHRYSDWSMGEFGGSKILKELVVEADTFGNAITLVVEGDNGNVIAEIPINHNGQARKVYTLPDNYTILFRVRQKSNTNIDWLLYDLNIRYEQAPDSTQPPTKFETGGYLGKKFLQRIIVDADTSGLVVNADIENATSNVVVPNIPLLHNGRSVKTYDFNPVTGYIFRLVPKGNIRIFDVQYKFDVEPEEQKIWKTQPTTHDIPGYQFVPRAIIAIKSTADVTFTLTIDGISFEYTIPNTNNIYRKLDIPLKAVKGQLFEYEFESSSPSVIVKKDCEVWIYPIKGGEVQIRNPFGHISREVGTA